MADSFELNEKIPAELNKVIPLVDMISQKTIVLTASSDEVFKIKLALEEALTNAVRHGNTLDPHRCVSVRVKATLEKIVMDVHDDGEGFNFENLPDPTVGDRVSKPSGRGVFLMRQLMDTVEFYDKGSGVKMIKFFSRKP